MKGQTGNINQTNTKIKIPKLTKTVKIMLREDKTNIQEKNTMTKNSTGTIDFINSLRMFKLFYCKKMFIV